MQHMLTSYSAQAEADWARYPAVPFPPSFDLQDGVLICPAFVPGKELYDVSGSPKLGVLRNPEHGSGG